MGAERRALERAEQSKAKMLVPRPPPQASARRKLTLKPSVINTNLERLEALALANNLREEEAAAMEFEGTFAAIRAKADRAAAGAAASAAVAALAAAASAVAKADAAAGDLKEVGGKTHHLCYISV